MRKPKAATPWLRPLFDSGEILGMIWTPPREPKEADEAWDPEQRGTTQQDQRGGAQRVPNKERFRQGLGGKGQA